LLHSIIKNFFFETDWLMIGALAFVGVIFIIYELQYQKRPVKNRNITDLSWQQAVLIGLGQASLTLPGVSRAGAVILTMMAMNYKRSEAAKYSFLLALPTICAAAGYDALKTINQNPISTQEWFLMMIGFGTAFIAAVFVLKWFISYLQKNTLMGFGIYRLVIAGILVLLFQKTLF
jgi:undecaprenyl-diphosphatase